MRLAIAVILFLSFTGWSTSVAFAHGLFGFLTVAMERPWALQMLIDLTLACFFAGTWLRADAKKRGLPAVPYLLGIVLLGSISLLAYFVHREFVALRKPQSTTGSA